MKKLVTGLLLLPSILFAQIDVDKAGDDWDGQVYRALHLVYGTSPEHYQQIIDFVDKVEFWNEAYSSNNGKGKTIVIAANDVKLNSINNIAAILVHESCHIKYSYVDGINLTEAEEEKSCYIEEFVFLNKLPNVESELLQHAKQQIEKYSK